MKRSKLIEILCAVVAGLLMYAGIIKLIHFHNFYIKFNALPFPDSLTLPFTVGIVAAEILIPIALMFEKTRNVGLISANILLFSFSVFALLVIVKVFQEQPCPCGGLIETLNWSQHLVLNSTFFGFSALAQLLQLGNTKKVNNQINESPILPS